jgi:hypothetical protein
VGSSVPGATAKDCARVVIEVVSSGGDMQKGLSRRLSMYGGRNRKCRPYCVEGGLGDRLGWGEGSGPPRVKVGGLVKADKEG